MWLLNLSEILPFKTFHCKKKGRQWWKIPLYAFNIVFYLHKYENMSEYSSYKVVIKPYKTKNNVKRNRQKTTL
jgi:hypothetical protein